MKIDSKHISHISLAGKPCFSQQKAVPLFYWKFFQCPVGSLKKLSEDAESISRVLLEAFFSSLQESISARCYKLFQRFTGIFFRALLKSFRVFCWKLFLPEPLKNVSCWKICKTLISEAKVDDNSNTLFRTTLTIPISHFSLTGKPCSNACCQGPTFCHWIVPWIQGMHGHLDTSFYKFLTNKLCNKQYLPK